MRLFLPVRVSKGVFLVAALSCCSATASPDAATDAADDATRDCASLTGAMPFAASLSGRAHFVADGGVGDTTDEVQAAIYFPYGRVAGAPVIFAIDGIWPRRTANSSTSNLGVDLAAGPFMVTSYRDSIFATLSPSGPVHARISRNFAMGTDIGMYFEADVDLCPTGDAPSPSITVTATRLAPTTPIDLGVTVPVDQPVQLHAFAGDTAIPLAADALAMFRAAPVSAWPPGAVIRLDANTWRDVLGRSYSVENVPTPLAATQPLTDRTFDTLPASNSADFDGVTPVIASGTLQLAAASPRPFAALFALGPPPVGSTGVVVRIGSDSYSPNRTAVVAADGSASQVVIGSMTPADVRVAIPGPGPLWLSIHVQQATTDPQRQRLPPLHTTVTLDEIRFE